MGIRSPAHASRGPGKPNAAAGYLPSECQECEKSTGFRRPSRKIVKTMPSAAKVHVIHHVEAHPPVVIAS